MLRELDFRAVFLGDRIGFGLTTANVLYHMPDYPGLLQSFVWQFHDVAPDYPRLHRFLDHWRREIEAVIHTVEVAHKHEAPRPELRHAKFHARLH
jgi:uncharacterized protein Usg